MLVELIATIAAGIAAGGAVLFLRRVLKLGLPGWLMPVAAAAAMFGLMIYNDYTWFERTRANLAPGIEVVTTYESSSVFQPWTMLRPRVTRFVALDTASTRAAGEAPDLLIAEVVLVKRYEPAASVPQVFDCEAGRRGDPMGQIATAADGSHQGVHWHESAAPDPLVTTICAPG